MAVLTAASVQEFIAVSGTQLGAIAARPDVRAMDPSRCDPIMGHAHLLNHYTANIATIDVRGRIVCSVLPLPPGGPVSVAASEWFQRARTTGRFTVGEPYVGPISHRRVALFVLPLDEGGRRIGYLTAPIDLVEFQQFFARLSSRSDTLVTVTTASGSIVARSRDAERYVGTHVGARVAELLDGGSGVELDVDGVARIYASAPVLGTPWVVISGIPTSVAYGATDRLLAALLAVCSILLVLAGLAAVGASRWIARPIQALGEHAAEIAGGGRGSPAAHGPREVVVASRRLGEMVTELRASETRLSDALDAAGMGAWAVELATGKTWTSPRHDQIFGRSELPTNWTIESALDQVVPDDRALFQERFAAASATGRFDVECRIAWPDGSEHWVAIAGRLERDADGAPARLSGTVADITERVRADDERAHLEQQLRQSQKMEAVGRLAGGVAHDFNNLLTAISGYSELALSRLGAEPGALRNDIEQIADAGERAARLTRQLLLFSRSGTTEATVFDLNDAVADSEALLTRLLGHQIDVAGALCPEGCMVEADRGQVEQIMMNLAVNARDAMPRGGTLAIETEVVRLEHAEAVERFDATAGTYALLRVADSGQGMDAETRSRAFEPFFTTKPPGEGTGLGLATVFGAVRRNGGHIRLASAPGSGTTVEILLPLVDKPEPSSTLPERAPASFGGDERVLLVEDDPVVLPLAREMLASRGYRVRTAAGAAEAIEAFRGNEFDIVVTDIVMPKQSGRELAARLHVDRPELPVVFVSGYEPDTAVAALESWERFVQKPYSADDLDAAIREVLDWRALAANTPS